MANIAGQRRRVYMGVRLRPAAVAVVERLQKLLKRHREKTSQARALEYALEYADVASEHGIDVVSQVKQHRGRIP